jgi:NADH-quinone oxidoreductase subunit M
MIFTLAAVGLPGTSGFIGEFLVVLGTIKVSFWWAFLAASTLIWGAAYTLWMIKRVVYGEVANEHVAALKDVTARELTFLVILAVAVLWMGVYPKPIADKINPTVQELLHHVSQKKI